MCEQEILYIVTNLITPRASLFLTYLLKLVQLEKRHSICRPRKPHFRTKHQVDRMTRCGDIAIRNCHAKFSQMRGRSLVGRREYNYILTLMS